MKPDTQFVLLTQAASHDELAALDRPNMSRRMVIGSTNALSLRRHLKSLAAGMSSRVPTRIRGRLSQLGHKLNTALKRRGAGSLLRDLEVDLLFCPFTAPTYFEPGIATVCTIYDLQYKTYPEFFSPEDVAHRAQTFNDAARRASALAAISDYSRESAITHGKLDPDLIRTIHLRMARRIADDTAGNQAVLRRLLIEPGRYLVYPANFWKHKNHEVLLTAFGIACKDSRFPSDVKLVCTGAPSERQKWLIRAAAAMGMAERIVFPGYLTNTDLSTVMANCGGVVFPSLYEGFGLPVIEAMAAGAPVACSNTTSLPEVSSGAAILFDPRVPTEIADAIVSLATDVRLRERLTDAGRRRAEEFADSERMAREYWDLFESALANVRHESLITGVTPDGWMGTSLRIQTAPQPGAEAIEVEIAAPEWIPLRSVSVQAYRRGAAAGPSVKIKRGSDTLISLPAGDDGVLYELRVSPTFVPAHCGMGSDERELSVMLRRCSVVANNAPRLNLFPENTPT
jgi:glycosyltransferase involved in cell wall biosynthesis